MNGFLTLGNRYIIKGILVACAPLHIGSGFEDLNAGSDAGFISDAAGPFVPGSSLRGVLRSRLERILQALGGNRGCVLFEEGSSIHPHCPTVNKTVREEMEALSEPELVERLFDSNGLCDICRLFGSPLLASKLQIGDARPVNRNLVEINKRDGVAIDRDSGTAADKLKFDFMVLEQFEHREQASQQDPQPVPLQFGFTMMLENANSTDLALLGILMTELTKEGIDVGAKKSRGFGRLRLQQNYEVECFNDKASLRTYLTSGNLSTMTSAEFGRLLQTKIEEYFSKYFSEAQDAQTSGE